eukprot:5903868-Karenia_brevis.AAC.1
MILPHEWLGCLYAHNRKIFDGMFLGGSDGSELLEFWTHEVNNAWAQHHPALENERDPSKRKMIPL